MSVFRGCVADKVPNELEYIGVAANIPKWVIAVGKLRVYKVKDADHIPLAHEQWYGTSGQFTFGIGADVRGICQIDIGLNDISCFSAAAAADDDLQQIPLVPAAVQAHLDMLSQNDIVLWVLISVFAVELPGVAPSRATMLFSDSAVFA